MQCGEIFGLRRVYIICYDATVTSLGRLSDVVSRIDRWNCVFYQVLFNLNSQSQWKVVIESEKSILFI